LPLSATQLGWPVRDPVEKPYTLQHFIQDGVRTASRGKW
jgi:hypothetical protein